MSFLWPEALYLLLGVPLLVAAYLAVLRRKKKQAVRYASLLVIREAMGTGPGWRRHVPPSLFLLALIAMIVAIARPVTVLTLPSQYRTVILAMDVSGSMRAADVEPNRLVAAQAAAKAFVDEQRSKTRIGVISFAATASVVQPPTESREDVIAAIDRFKLQRGTAIGSGIIVSLATIFPDAGIDISAYLYGGGSDSTRDFSRDKAGNRKKPSAETKEFKKVAPGSHTSAAIILLTDGQRTTGPDPMEAARMAADRGVKIFTVGVGTVAGNTIGFEGWSMRVRLDEETLKNIANMTQGEYFYAGTAPDLKKIYQGLNARISMEKKETEVTALFSAAAGLLAVIAAGLSLLWFHRVV